MKMIKDLKSMDENIRIVQDAIFWHQVNDNSYSNKYIEKFIREYCLKLYECNHSSQIYKLFEEYEARN